MSRLELPYTSQERHYTNKKEGFLCDDTVSQSDVVSYVYDTIDSLSIIAPEQ